MNPLSALLDLPDYEKLERGLVHTPREILQQPVSWQLTLDGVRSRLPEIRDFLSSSGLRDTTASVR